MPENIEAKKKHNTIRRRRGKYWRTSLHLIHFYPLCVLHYFSVILVIGQLYAVEMAVS